MGNQEVISEKHPAIIFAGTESRDVALKICEKYGIPLGKSVTERFSDGEFSTYYEETVRGKYVFIVQSTFAPTDNLFELLLMIDAARRASAYKIIAVVPYFGFARQDRKDKSRVCIGAKMVANLLTSAGVDRVISTDLHTDQIQGFFDVPVDHLYSSSIFIPYLEQLNLPDLVIASPDTGGIKRAHAYAKHLNTDLVMCHKTRAKANVIESMSLIGNVEGKNVVLIDDIADTAGSMTRAAQVMVDHGAKSVRAFVTHPILSGPAYERIDNSAFLEFVTTDTIPLRKESKKIKVLSIASMFADVIKRVHTHQSISGYFISR